MTSKPRFLLCLVALSVSGGTGAPLASSAAEPALHVNYMPNPGFEIAKDRWADGWSKFHDPTSSKLELDAQVKKSGKYSAHISFIPNAPDKASRYSGFIRPLGGMFRPGSTYTYSAYVKTRDFHGTIWLEALQYPAPFGTFIHRSAEQVPGTTDWMRIKLTFQARPDIADVQFRCMAHSHDMHGEIWFDDLKVEEGPAPTPFTETWQSEFYRLGPKPNGFNVPFDYEGSPQVATPCVAPLRWTGADKISVLFVASWGGNYSREAVELFQRADIAVSTVAINDIKNIHEDCILRLRKLLKNNPRVLVLQPEVWDGLLTPDRTLIENCVNGGMGLVFYNAGNPSEKMKTLFAKGSARSDLPPSLVNDVNVWRLGKGIIVLQYRRDFGPTTLGRESGYDRAVHSLWLAAQKPFGEMKVTLNPTVPVAGQPWKLHVEVVDPQMWKPAEVQVRIRPTAPVVENPSRFTPLPVLQQRTVTYGAAGVIEMDGLPAGQYFVEAAAVDAQKQPVAWRLTPVVNDGPVRIWSATPLEPALRRGKDVKVKVLLENNSGAEQTVTLRSALYDTNERMLMRSEAVGITLLPGRTEKQISAAASHSTTPMAELRLELADKQGTLDQLSVPLCAEPVLPEPDFRLCIYGDLHCGGYQIGADTFVEPLRPNSVAGRFHGTAPCRAGKQSAVDEEGRRRHRPGHHRAGEQDTGGQSQGDAAVPRGGLRAG